MNWDPNILSESPPDREVLEYMESFFKLEEIEKEYADLEVSLDNFLQNLINLGSLGTTASLRKCTGDLNDSDHILSKLEDLLHFYALNWNMPLVYHFSAWNFEKWKDLIKCCEIENSDSIAEVIKEQIKTWTCTDQEMAADYYLTADFVYAKEGLSRCYEDYNSWLLQNEEEAQKQDEILKRLNLNSRKVFFVSFMQQYCYHHHIIGILVLLNSEEFAREFDCESDSRMNPENKCVIKLKKYSHEESDVEEIVGD